MRAFRLKSMNWKYIVGEVLLIFLGITMAIWFDNWNSQQKIDQRKEEAVVKIREEIEQNLAELTDARDKNSDIAPAIMAFRGLVSPGYKGTVTTPEKMHAYLNSFPGFFTLKDSVYKREGLYGYEGETFINLELAALSDIAWETTKELDIANDLGFECLYDLETMYNVQQLVQVEIDKSSEALQNQEIDRMLRILEFMRQLGAQLEQSYQAMLGNMDVCL